MGNDRRQLILLTGAGFTHDFGGFLANDMWAEIFNHADIQERPNIQKMMKNSDFDYETVYEDIVYDSSGTTYDISDQDAIERAILNAYNNQQNRISRKCDGGEYYDAIYITLPSLLKKCDYFFTLNQDIFVEKYLIDRAPELFLPGIPILPTIPRSWSYRGAGGIVDMSLSEIPGSISEDNVPYIKLHGSYNWRSAHGYKMMLIGHHKQERMEKEPILEWYYKLFGEALFTPKSTLLVIGYSFRDEHINNIINEAIQLYELKLHVVSPESPRDFFFKFEDKRIHRGSTKNIVQGLSLYYPYTLMQFLHERVMDYLGVIPHQ